MDEAEREQFHRLAQDLFGEVGELTEILEEEVARMTRAKEEVRTRLAAGLDGAKTPEAKSLVERALKAEEQARDQVALLVGEALQRAQQIRKASAGRYPAEPGPDLGPEDAAKKLAQMRAELFSLDIAKFYYALLLILLNGSIAVYVDMCEGFLGHAIGSHEARRRSMEVLKRLSAAGVDVAVGIFLAPIAIPAAFVESVVEAIKQLRATPEREARRWEEQIAAGNDQRAILIEKSKAIAEHEVPHLQEYVTVSLEAVEEELSQIGRQQQ